MPQNVIKMLYTPACQMKAAKTALMDSATLGLIASTTGPWGG